MKKMGAVTEGQNYQDYMIPHTWGSDEEQEIEQEIGGMQVEPTQPSAMEVVKSLLMSNVGLSIMALIGSVLLYRGFKNE